jgi:crotonobetainyl-CoA:carnitine CoA-transferase CaiB-like acyl-CoA transferase
LSALLHKAAARDPNFLTAMSFPPTSSTSHFLGTEAHRPDAPSGKPQPLAGVRVLDLTRLLPGAYCTQLLADMGAEVIKVEQPGSGDYWRWMEPRVHRHGYQFLALNRGKQSITLDLKHAGAREAFLRLCETADVVIEGFRPGVMARLGLGSDTLRRHNPRLVYCAMTGFGQNGPDAQVAAHDLNYQGMTGLLHYVNGSRTTPRPTALPVGDIGGGALMALSGVLAALFERERTGTGRDVDISVVDGLLSWVGFMTSQWNVPALAGEPVPFDAPFDKPFYTVYETADACHLVVGAYEPKFWQTLCEVLELPQWIERQWVDGTEEEAQRRDIAAALRRRTQQQWLDLFATREACVTPVLTVREALAGAHATARGMVITVDDPVEGPLQHIACPLRFDGVAPSALAPCPALGAQTESLLQAAGLDEASIESLRRAGAI